LYRHARKTQLAVVATIATVAAGCGGARHAAAPPTSANLAARWHQVVLCARAHGMPGLQDPRIDSSGKAIFPTGLNIPAETRRACQSLVDRLVPDADKPPSTPGELAGLLRFARCMRGHGIPDWPDPRPDGTFVPPARIMNGLKSTFRSQLMACEHLNPDPHGRVYFKP
jgi:hypothetical protein